MKIGGLGRAALDITVTVPVEVAREVLPRHGFLASGVQIVEDKDGLLKVWKELGEYGQSTLAPGEPVSNTLHVMGICQESRASPLALHWFGSIGPKDHKLRYSIDPVDSLRRVSIIPYCIAYARRDNLALCIVAEETKQVIAIIAQTNQGVLHSLSDLPVMDVFVVLMLDLLRANGELLEYIWQSKALALIVGDTVNASERSFNLLNEFATSEKLKWVFGRYDDVARHLLIEGDTINPAFQHVEVVGTQGPSPVIIWHPAKKQFLSFDVPPLIHVEGNELGAGDAYAGGYLHHRILGNSVTDSHLIAAACAADVLKANSARAEPENNLNVVFGQTIGRISQARDEGRLYDRIRTAPGVTLVSGGQTGVDQIALRAATELGLPSFCIMPQGRRTELSDHFEGVDHFGDSYVRELESASYRYRTWATVFLADGTLIWDFHGGEGSSATRDACHGLGRPFLDIACLGRDDVLSTVAQWVDQHSIRVINIAGSRGSRLTSDQKVRVALETLRLLRFVSYHRTQAPALLKTFPMDDTNKGIGSSRVHSPGALRIGVPSAAGHRALFESFLREAFGLLPPAPRSLVVKWEEPALEVVFARSRDLPVMLKEGAIDLALCGSDLLYEEETPSRLLLDTGLFPCFVVLVGKTESLEAENHGVAVRFGSQYPRLASKLLSDRKMNAPVPVREIHGTAEAWMNIGLIDAAVDTWQTGAAADANNLSLHRIFFETSLVLVNLESDPTTDDARIDWFVNNLSAWLAGSTHPQA